jgi:hypothetical protein
VNNSNSTEAVTVNESFSDLSDEGLTDATDDFDFVTVENESGWSALTFRTMDNRTRTDIWLSNQQEVEDATHETYPIKIDPWDPDTDDDGLTDGWEQEGYMPEVEITDEWDGKSTSLTMNESAGVDGLSPTDPDSDGDQYWDGWIGVYGVGYTDNVVLYRENLRSGDGIESHEMVSEQTGYHNTSAVGGTSEMSADIDDDGDDEHSNIHIGERIWETNPMPSDTGLQWDGDEPSPEISIEVDYYEDANTSALDTPEWEQRLEENLAMFDINASIERDETITKDQATSTRRGHFGVGYKNINPSDGFGDGETAGLHNDFHDSNGYHMTVMDEHHDEGVGGYTPKVWGDWMGIYGPTSGSSLCANQTRVTQLITQQTALHEIGHVMNVGKNDDETSGVTNTGPLYDEVYSGYNKSEDPKSDNSDITDPTPEQINASKAFKRKTGTCSTGKELKEWSAMSEAWSPVSHYFAPPFYGHYAPYSMEELLTVKME